MYFCGQGGRGVSARHGEAARGRARTSQTAAASLSRSSMATGSPSCGRTENVATSASLAASSSATEDGGGPSAASRTALWAGDAEPAAETAEPACDAAMAAPASAGAHEDPKEATEPPSETGGPEPRPARSMRRRAEPRAGDPAPAASPCSWCRRTRPVTEPAEPDAALDMSATLGLLRLEGVRRDILRRTASCG